MAKDLKVYPAEKKGELLTLATIDELNEMARQVRRDIIRMLARANSGHTGGSLGMADIFTALYFRLLKKDPHKFWQSDDQDFVFLSYGHIQDLMTIPVGARFKLTVSPTGTFSLGALEPVIR